VTAPLSLLDLPRFEIDPVRGFMPTEEPLQRLPPGYEAWDDLGRRLPELLERKRFRAAVAALPAIDPTPLDDPAAVRRAMLLLSAFGNAYVWETETAAQRIPAPLALPLWKVAERVGRPPIIAHASMVLANWRRLDPNGSLEVDNLDTLVVLHDLQDERWFFLITAAIEVRGAPAIRAMIQAQHGVARHDAETVARELGILAETIAAVTAIMDRMYERCDPGVFYRLVRPCLTGWPEPGVIYEGVSDAPVRLTGGSAAQSALIQAFDAGLGVQHPSPVSGPFLTEMRSYMPPAHRRFLEHLERGPSIAAFVNTHTRGAEPELHDRYEACLDQLDHFRKRHLGLAARYITQESRGDPAARGTGGTDFVAFLSTARRETEAAKHGVSPADGPPRRSAS